MARQNYWAGWDLAKLAVTTLVSFGVAALRFRCKVLECPQLRDRGTRGQGLTRGQGGQGQGTGDKGQRTRGYKDKQEGQSLPLFPSPLSPSPPLPSGCGLLLNNPHNPTGCLFLRETILPYLEQFALVVVDEAFMDFLPPDQEQVDSGLSNLSDSAIAD